MSGLHHLRNGFNEAWDNLMDGWQRLYRHAAGAITRFTHETPPGKETADPDRSEMAARSTGWGVLTAEVFDDDDKIIVRLEAPGLEKDDFDLQVVDDHLVISGEKQIERERTQGRYHVTECAYGRFERSIPLPEDVQTENADATYRNGVLRVELPKAPLRRRTVIKVGTK